MANGVHEELRKSVADIRDTIAELGKRLAGMEAKLDFHFGMAPLSLAAEIRDHVSKQKMSIMDIAMRGGVEDASLQPSNSRPNLPSDEVR